MGTIYQKNGLDVYDDNGATYNAKTGAVISGDPQPPNPFAQPTTIGAVTQNPVVTPNATGSLQNTMTTPPPPPTTPTAPAVGTPPSSTNATPGAGLDPSAFTNVLEGVKQNFAANNKLIDQKNLLIKGLFTSPLTPDQVAQLDPDIQQVWNTGNKDAIELQLAALNDRIQGGTNNFSQSVNYLVNGYQTSVAQAEKQKSDALNTVQSFVTAYGSKAGDALRSLYGTHYVDTLKSLGIDLNSFASLPTIAETKANAAAKPGSGIDPASPYAGVIGTILASGKFTKAQAAAITDAINGGEDPLTVIKNNAKNIMGQTEATSVSKFETAEQSLKDLQKNLSDFYAAGGNTNIFSGNYEKVLNKLGAVNSPDLVDLATQIQSNLQIYRNAISGTAYSAQEGADISSIFPGINKTEGLNNAILSGRMKAFDSQIDSAYGSAIGQDTYKALKDADTSKNVSDATSDPEVIQSLKSQLQPEEILVSREAADGRHYTAVLPSELWATDIKL